VSVPSPVELAPAGGPAEAARRRAFARATGDLVPTESTAISYPVPVGLPSGRGFAFFLCPILPDRSVRDVFLLEPHVHATVDRATLDVTACEKVREAVAPELEEPACYGQPTAARLLSADHLNALTWELVALADRVGEAFERPSMAEPDRAAAERFARLFRFLVPAEMVPFYERLNPEFFAWLQARIPSPAPSDRAPQSDPTFTPPPMILPEFFEAMDVADLPKPGAQPWRLSGPVLAEALGQLGLSPAPHSPLAGVMASGAPEGFRLVEMVPGWPTVEWQHAMRTLCQPTWELIQVAGRENVLLTTNVYVGAEADGAMWVHHRVENDLHVVSFPHGPGRLTETMLDALDAAAVRVARARAHVFSAAELMVVLACADAWNAGESAPALADDAVRRALAPAGAAPGLRWSAVCQALAPLPLPKATTVFEPGLAGLCERRLMSGNEGRLLPDPRLRVLLRSLSPPTAFAALQTIRRATDSAVAAGFAAVRTPSALWLLEAAEDTAWGPADPGPRVRLFQVTGRQLRAAIEAMIGAETRRG
jgi:hypothetical protein